MIFFICQKNGKSFILFLIVYCHSWYTTQRETMVKFHLFWRRKNLQKGHAHTYTCMASKIVDILPQIKKLQPLPCPNTIGPGVTPPSSQGCARGPAWTWWWGPAHREASWQRTRQPGGQMGCGMGCMCVCVCDWQQLVGEKDAVVWPLSPTLPWSLALLNQAFLFGVQMENNQHRPYFGV